MRQKFIFFFTLALTFLSMHLKADEIIFKALAPDAVVMGEQFRLVYMVNAEGKELRVPDLSDFEVLMGPSTSTSMSTQFVNGKTTTTASYSFIYILMPKKEGTFNLSPGTIKVKNANYSSNSLIIKVLPQDNSAAQGQGAGNGSASSPSSGLGIGNNELFIRVTASNRSVYEQEGFLVTFKLYSLYEAGLGNVKFPEFDGFLVQDIELDPQWTLENYEGKNYRTVIIKQSVLYPQHTGKITIGSGKYEAVVRVRTQKRVRSFFDDILDTYQNMNKELTSSPVTIDVKPLPSGKPASFSGAVGSYLMNTSINTNSLKTNEAVTIKVTLTGNGNIKLLKNPEVIFPNDFEVYDPKVENNIKTTASGSSGTKTIEYMAIPRYAGDFEIPAVQFSYFDPKTGAYKTLSSEVYKLHVEKGVGGEAASPVVSNYSNQESLRLLGQDIRYIKTSNIQFVSTKEIFFGSFTYILVYVIIIVLFGVFFFIYRKQVRENADIALVRTKKANKMAIRRLKKAEKLLKEKKKEEFYEEVLRAIWGYLSDKLNISQASLTKDNVEAELKTYGVDDTLLKEFMDILHACEFARYAPNQAPDAMDALFKQTIDAIGKMDNTIKR